MRSASRVTGHGNVLKGRRAASSSRTLPLGGFSPGNMYQTTHTRYTLETAEYVAVANGNRFMIRLDHEETIQPCLDRGWDVIYVYGATFSYAGIPGGSVAAYAAECANIAGRWKNVTGLGGARLQILEVGGNEPNNGNMTPAQHLSVIRACTPAVKAVDPTLLISNGGLGPFADSGSQMTPRTFVTGMFTAGLTAGDIDIYQGHLYEHATQRGTWNTWDQTFPNAPGSATLYGTFAAGTTIREMLDAHGMSSVKVMSGETGLPSQTGLYLGKMAIEDAFNDFRSRRAAGEQVGPVLVFTMRPDWVTLGTDSGYGCVDSSWTRSAAWTAAQTGIAA